MNRVRQSSRRWLVLAALGGVLAIMAVGAGIALAVSQGTAGELNYQRNETAVSGPVNQTVKARCPQLRHVTGGGYEHVSEVEVEASRPFDSGDAGTVPDDGWEVEFAPSGAAVEEFVAVYAICDD